jgi:Uncharacterized alpha/beta hydrolase domain (DUF2235)
VKHSIIVGPSSCFSRFLSRGIHRTEVCYTVSSNFLFRQELSNTSSLAGMLQKVGLLPAHNIQQIPFAYKMYTRCDEIGWEQSTAFKKAFCVDVKIEFIGVW